MAIYIKLHFYIGYMYLYRYLKSQLDIMLIEVLLVFSSVYAAQAKTDRVVCYYQSWAYYQPSNGAVTPEDLDPKLCTHINYAFIGLNGNGALKVEDEYLDVEKHLFKRVTDLKKKNPKLKVLLSIGGADDKRTKIFAEIAKSAAKRANFVKSCASFMKKYGFDGVDIDWEYPKKGDKKNFITLLKKLYGQFHPKGWLVTAAVASSPSEGYDVAGLNKYLDQINIMAYDMYGDWSDYIGQNSPLYPSSVESKWEKDNLNVAAAIKNWLKAGVLAKKVNLGMAFYGRSFALANPKKHGIHATFSGPADPMPYLKDGWSYSYAEICQFTKKWTTVWDDEQKVPYRYKGKNWVGYDDPKSIALKTKYVVSQGLGGVMMWSVDQDDVHGKCGEKFGLLRTIHKVLGI